MEKKEQLLIIKPEHELKFRGKWNYCKMENKKFIFFLGFLVFCVLGPMLTVSVTNHQIISIIILFRHNISVDFTLFFLLLEWVSSRSGSVIIRNKRSRKKDGAKRSEKKLYE